MTAPNIRHTGRTGQHHRCTIACPPWKTDQRALTGGKHHQRAAGNDDGGRFVDGEPFSTCQFSTAPRRPANGHGTMASQMNVAGRTRGGQQPFLGRVLAVEAGRFVEERGDLTELARREPQGLRVGQRVSRPGQYRTPGPGEYGAFAGVPQYPGRRSERDCRRHRSGSVDCRRTGRCAAAPGERPARDQDQPATGRSSPSSTYEGLDEFAAQDVQAAELLTTGAVNGIRRVEQRAEGEGRDASATVQHCEHTK